MFRVIIRLIPVLVVAVFLSLPAGARAAVIKIGVAGPWRLWLNTAALLLSSEGRGKDGEREHEFY